MPLDRYSAAGWFPTYYVSGSSDTSAPPRPDMGWAYEDWAVNRFLGLYYDMAPVPPDEVLLPFPISDAALTSARPAMAEMTHGAGCVERISGGAPWAARISITSRTSPRLCERV